MSTKIDTVNRFPNAITRTAALTAKHTAEAANVARNSVRYNMKNFAVSNCKPSQHQ